MKSQNFGENCIISAWMNASCRIENVQFFGPSVWPRKRVDRIWEGWGSGNGQCTCWLPVMTTGIAEDRVCTLLMVFYLNKVSTGCTPFLSPNWSTQDNTHHHTTTILWPFLWDHPGELVPDFMMQSKINRGRHTDPPARRHSIRTNQCPPPPSPIFFRPDALPAAQPTVSKRWRQLV